MSCCSRRVCTSFMRRLVCLRVDCPCTTMLLSRAAAVLRGLRSDSTSAAERQGCAAILTGWQLGFQYLSSRSMSFAVWRDVLC